MRKLVHWLPAVALVAPSACAFLLDFDDLQKAEPGDASVDSSLGGTGNTSGSGGTSGTGGSGGGAAGSGGNAGTGSDGGDAGPCGKSCDDGDPCTTDACVTPDGGSPICVHGGKLHDDGALDLPMADYLGGLSVAGGSDRFYVSSYAGTKKDAGGYEYNTSVFEVPVTGTVQKGQETVLWSSDVDGGLGFAQGPRGPVGLVHDGTTLRGFVAYQVDGFDWRVKQLAFPADLKAAPTATELCAGGCYSFTIDGTRRPSPFLGPDGKAAAMWPGPDGIWVGSETNKPTQKTIPASSVSDLSPVISDTTVGAFWRDSSTPYLTLIGGKSASPTSCYAGTSAFAGLTSAGRGRLWSTAFATKAGTFAPVTEFNSYLLVGDQWQEFSNCKTSQTSVFQGLHLPAMTAFQHPATAPKDRVHFALAAVSFSDSSLGVNGSYIELEPTKTELVGVGQYEMAGPPSPKLTGSSTVDAPVIGYAKDKLLVAWRDYAGVIPGIEGTLRLRRFKLCGP